MGNKIKPQSAPPPTSKTAQNRGISFSQHRIGVVIISFLILAYYIWTAGSNGVPLIVDVGPEHHEQVRTPNLFPDISPHHYGFYNLMADAFEAGQMHLLIKPPQELIKLSDPLDPTLNEKTRILDIAYYKERFYLYFGSVPTFVLFIPFRWLGIGKISEPLAVAIFSYCLFLSSLYILLNCVKRFINNYNNTLLLLGICAIAISNTIPYNLRHPVVYEVAISAGAFFSMLGLAFLLKSWGPNYCHRGWLLAASFAFGLSVGCRPIYVFSAIFIFFVWLLLAKKRNYNIAEIFLDGIALALPFSICIGAVMYYNYIRFGSAGEFGMSFMMGPTYWDKFFKQFYNRFANIPTGLFFTAFCPPKINDIFPFFHLRPFLPPFAADGYVCEEPSAGFFATAPISFYGVVSLIYVLTRKKICYALFISTILFIYALCILIPELYMMFGTTMRYQMDFAPTIILASTLSCLYFESQIQNSLRKSLYRICAGILICFGILAHLAFGLTGIFDTFRRGEPSQYFALENFFRPLSAILRPFFGVDQTKIVDITSPNGSLRFEDGSEGHWVGKEGFFVRFTAAQTIPMQFSADVFVLPDLPGGVKLEFQNPAGFSTSSVVKGISRQTFQFTLQPGINRISIFANPNGPSKEHDKLQLAVLRNIQVYHRQPK